MPFLERAGTKIAYDVVGPDGAPLVTLINGYGRSRNDFKAMSRYLSREGFRLLTLDNRGAGETRVDEGFSFDDLVDDVAALWDAVGEERSHLAGLSFGGMIALHVAAKRRERVKSLAVVSTTPFHSFLRGGDRPLREEDVLRYFSDSFRQKSPFLVNALVKEITRNGTDDKVRGQLSFQEALINSVDLRPILPKVTAPTIVIHGEVDGVSDVAGAKLMHEAIAGSELAVLDEAGHLLLAEAPAKLYELTGAFFKKHENN